jgi:hypothetical protein
VEPSSLESSFFDLRTLGLDLTLSLELALSATFLLILWLSDLAYLSQPFLDGEFHQEID